MESPLKVFVIIVLLVGQVLSAAFSNNDNEFNQIGSKEPLQSRQPIIAGKELIITSSQEYEEIKPQSSAQKQSEDQFKIQDNRGERQIELDLNKTEPEENLELHATELEEPIPELWARGKSDGSSSKSSKGKVTTFRNSFARGFTRSTNAVSHSIGKIKRTLSPSSGSSQSPPRNEGFYLAKPNYRDTSPIPHYWEERSVLPPGHINSKFAELVRKKSSQSNNGGYNPSPPTSPSRMQRVPTNEYRAVLNSFGFYDSDLEDITVDKLSELIRQDSKFSSEPGGGEHIRLTTAERNALFQELQMKLAHAQNKGKTPLSQQGVKRPAELLTGLSTLRRKMKMYSPESSNQPPPPKTYKQSIQDDISPLSQQGILKPAEITSRYGKLSLKRSSRS